MPSKVSHPSKQVHLYCKQSEIRLNNNRRWTLEQSYIYHNTFLSRQYRSDVFAHGLIKLEFSWVSASFTVVLFSHCICCLDRMFYQRKCSLWKRHQLVSQMTLFATTNYLAGTRLIYLFRYELAFVLLPSHISKPVRLKSCWLKQTIIQISICTTYYQLFILCIVFEWRKYLKGHGCSTRLINCCAGRQLCLRRSGCCNHLRLSRFCWGNRSLKKCRIFNKASDK